MRYLFNAVFNKEKNTNKQKCKLTNKCSLSHKLTHHEQILRICLTSFLMSLAIVLSMVETKIRFTSEIYLPLRIFDSIIFILALPTVGIFYAGLIGILVPWIHFLLDSDHNVIEIFFDSLINMIIVVSFFWTYKKIFLNKNKIAWKTNFFNSALLIAFNALVVTLVFNFLLVFIFNYNIFAQLSFNKWLFLQIAFFMIEIIRITFIFILFVIIHNKIKIQNNN